MSKRRQVLVALCGIVVFAAACGASAGPSPATTSGPTAGAPSVPPTVPSVSTAVPASAAATEAPILAPTDAPPSVDPASEEPTDAAPTGGSSDLMSLIPTEAGAYTVQAQAVPAEFVDDYVRGVEDLLGAVGASPEDVELVLAGASGSDPSDTVTIYALRVAGADTQQLVQAEVDRWLAQMVEGTEAAQVNIGGKDVIQVGEQDPSFPKYAKYVYGVGDVVFALDAAASDEAIEAVLSALP